MLLGAGGASASAIGARAGQRPASGPFMTTILVLPMPSWRTSENSVAALSGRSRTQPCEAAWPRL